jgi:hypothetical protein
LSDASFTSCQSTEEGGGGEYIDNHQSHTHQHKHDIDGEEEVCEICQALTPKVASRNRLMSALRSFLQEDNPVAGTVRRYQDDQGKGDNKGEGVKEEKIQDTREGEGEGEEEGEEEENSFYEALEGPLNEQKTKIELMERERMEEQLEKESERQGGGEEEEEEGNEKGGRSDWKDSPSCTDEREEGQMFQGDAHLINNQLANNHQTQHNHEDVTLSTNEGNSNLPPPPIPSPECQENLSPSTDALNTTSQHQHTEDTGPHPQGGFYDVLYRALLEGRARGRVEGRRVLKDHVEYVVKVEVCYDTRAFRGSV